MPIGLTTATLREYTLEERELDREQAEARLQQVLLARLEAQLKETEGEVLRTDFVTRVEDGRLTVTLLAECQEEIGKTVERKGETGHVPGEGQQQAG